MTPLTILQGISVDELLTRTEKVIEKKLEEKLALLKPSKEWQYMNRKDVAELLKISLPTLHNWTKDGLLNSYRIGTRVLYRSDEIEKSLTNRKFKRINPIENSK
jgi:excisionase family DNA binding protein